MVAPRPRCRRSPCVASCCSMLPSEPRSRAELEASAFPRACTVPRRQRARLPIDRTTLHRISRVSWGPSRRARRHPSRGGRWARRSPRPGWRGTIPSVHDQLAGHAASPARGRGDLGTQIACCDSVSRRPGLGQVISITRDGSEVGPASVRESATTDVSGDSISSGSTSGAPWSTAVRRRQDDRQLLSL